MDCDVLVSIIIPVYNVEKYLEECLDSILKQTYKNIEVICVNDGSTDNSLNILEKYAVKDNRFIVLNQSNHGLSYSRNKGLKQARGKYIYYLDSDDYILPNTIKTLAENIEERDLEVLLFNANVFGDIGIDEKVVQNDVKYFTRTGDYPLIYKGEDFLKILLENKQYIASVPLQFSKRNFLLKNKLYFRENIIHEDELYTFQCLLKASKVGYLNQKFYYRRVRSNSTMSSLTNSVKMAYSIYSCFICFQEMLIFFNNTEIQSVNKTAIFQRIKQLLNICRARYAMVDESIKAKVFDYGSLDQNAFSLLVLDFYDIDRKLKNRTALLEDKKKLIDRFDIQFRDFKLSVQKVLEMLQKKESNLCQERTDALRQLQDAKQEITVLGQERTDALRQLQDAKQEITARDKELREKLNLINELKLKVILMKQEK